MSEYIAKCRGRFLNMAYENHHFAENKDYYYTLKGWWDSNPVFAKPYKRKGAMDRAMQKIGAPVFLNHVKISYERVNVHAAQGTQGG